MIYVFPITVPANTSEENPQETRVRLDYGLIHWVSVGFPAGCAGLVRVAIFDRLHQLWPSNAGDWYAWDGANIEVTEEYPLTDRPYELTVKAWNEDDSYDHTVVIRFGLAEGRARGFFEALMSLLAGPGWRR